ncbi:MAG: CinA family nicotinamide mononucleotide deamidase-related protein [Thermoguttaceae bacterium]|nr:CinA family nicotinamide mononucleotide deamidase-related protein [Thermoguttaceae bacterium]MDW8080027.1 CinA family nicotinamide mononucleotide deamidase-related protein [Thermoguttaceae bacterium]
MIAEIIVTGDEIISGRILDTNSQWLSIQLEDLGVRVLYHTAVGDEVDALVSVFRIAIERADLIVTTGGLGPTKDDLTREGLAQATGRPLREDPSTIEHLKALFARRNRPFTEAHRKQALFPEGSRPIPNPRGTAPGIAMEVPRSGRGPAHVFCLPGVPAEMREMWARSVGGMVRAILGRGKVIVHRTINTFGRPESEVEALLADLPWGGPNPRAGINASEGTIILRLAADGNSEEECQALLEPLVRKIYERLGELVFGENEEGLQHAVVKLLRQQNRRLAIAEWGTSGLVGSWLGEVPDPAPYFAGGWVISGVESLASLLAVPPDLASQQDLRQSRVVEALAIRCREAFQTDLALAVGPFPQDTPHPDAPGQLVLALATSEGTQTRGMGVSGHPAIIKPLCAKHALNFVRLHLVKSGQGRA